jgi:hypothetical protein
MPLLFARTAGDRRRLEAPQRSLFEPAVAGRRFAREAHRFAMSDERLKERLAELDLKRRRAQIRARKALDAPEPAPLSLPFAV